MSIYVPRHFDAGNRVAIARLLHDHPFATLITPTVGEPQVSHVPLLWVGDCEPHGTLIGHFARTNPHAEIAEAAESIAIFHGPHAYISPSWYAEPAAAVPTWNYAVVHAHGTLHLARAPAETRAILDVLIHRFESGRDAPWQPGLDRARMDAMVNAIVGFRMKIKRIDAKFKLSQNRAPDDRMRVAAALAAEGHADADATAAWMRAHVVPADGQS
ncbi:MAG: FMN-binding negative transcriptional regulator [Casimicrobiaceae bacterium]